MYQTYRECIQGLHKQGIFAFYKGNACRVFHIFGYEYMRVYLLYRTDSSDQIYQRSSFFKEYCAALTASLFMHPFHFAEARWVLNNRLPAFSAYKSSFTLFLSASTQLGRGTTAYVPRNFILAMTGYNYFSAINIYSFYAQMLLFHTIQYPLLTV